LRVRPTPERPLSPCVISTVLHSPDSIAAAAWRTWIMNEQPPTAANSFVSHFGKTTEKQQSNFREAQSLGRFYCR
jgi:hypothetical protein